MIRLRRENKLKLNKRIIQNMLKQLKNSDDLKEKKNNLEKE